MLKNKTIEQIFNINSENIYNIEWSNHKKWLSFYINKNYYSVEINQLFKLNQVNLYETNMFGKHKCPLVQKVLFISNEVLNWWLNKLDASEKLIC